MAKPIVAIIGRPNVGKSTLFNRLGREQRSIIADFPGTTRDRIYVDASYEGREFTLIDTGGIVPDPSDVMEKHILQQAQLAFEEADVVVMLFDATSGALPQDEILVDKARRANKPIIFAINKVDNPRLFTEAQDYYRLGIDNLIFISAAHGQGISDLMDSVLEALPPQQEADPILQAMTKIAVIGRPNVGKSSLINKLLQEERLIVSEIPGTTRDSVDTIVRYDDKDYVFIDTAGIRRKRGISFIVEKFSVVKSLTSIDRCDVALLLVDAVEGITDQDIKVAAFAHDKGKGCIIAVNKWDIVDQDNTDAKHMEERIRFKSPFNPYAPILFISAKTGRRISGIFKEIEKIAVERQRNIATPELNKFLERVTREKQPHLTNKHRRIHMNYITQISQTPPTFVVFVNYPKDVHFSYERYIINQLRETYGFYGNPIRVFFREKH